jgi:hypothetical protein
MSWEDRARHVRDVYLSSRRPAMIRVVFYFQVHQPFRLRHFTFFDIGSGADWFDDTVRTRASCGAWQRSATCRRIA